MYVIRYSLMAVVVFGLAVSILTAPTAYSVELDDYSGAAPGGALNLVHMLVATAKDTDINGVGSYAWSGQGGPPAIADGVSDGVQAAAFEYCYTEAAAPYHAAAVAAYDANLLLMRDTFGHVSGGLWLPFWETEYCDTGVNPIICSDGIPIGDPFTVPEGESPNTAFNILATFHVTCSESMDWVGSFIGGLYLGYGNPDYLTYRYPLDGLGLDRSLAGIFGPNGDIDGDGTTNLDEWNQVKADAVAAGYDDWATVINGSNRPMRDLYCGWYVDAAVLNTFYSPVMDGSGGENLPPGVCNPVPCGVDLSIWGDAFANDRLPVWIGYYGLDAEQVLTDLGWATGTYAQADFHVDWEKVDLEGFDEFLLGNATTTGDGLPDAAQMALITNVICDNCDRTGYFSIVRGEFESNRCMFYNNLLTFRTYDYAAFQSLFNYGPLMAAMIGSSAAMRDTLSNIFGQASSGQAQLLPYQYFIFTEVTKLPNELFAADGDLDGDGYTNLEEFDAVGGDIAAFVNAATDNFTTPNTPATSSNGRLVLIAVMVALALVAAWRSRRAEI